MDNMPVFLLNSSILMMCIWAGKSMIDSTFLKKFCKILKFTSLKNLSTLNLFSKLIFNISLKNFKNFKSLGFCKKKSPREPDIIIYDSKKVSKTIS